MATEEKPSRNEEEYFAKMNADLIKERRALLDAARAQAERNAHHMKCPKCGGDLKEIEQLEHAQAGGVTKFFGSVFGRRG